MRPSAFEAAAQACQRATERAAARVVAAPEPARGAMRQRNSYTGGTFNRLNSDWLASLLSPNDEIRGDLRTLRARARELARNDAYAGQYLEMVTTNVIGPLGQTFKATNRLRNNPAGDLDEAVNTEIELAWERWATGPVTADGTMSFVEMQELALETAAKEGEQFLKRVTGRDFAHGLGLQMIDPDLVDDSYSLPGSRLSPEIHLGVEVDSIGRRLGYHVLDYPYGPGQGTRARRRVDASDVIHAYRPKRANQMRGITWMARAMSPIKDLERYSQNELVASAAGAAKMGFIENEAGAGAVTTDVVTDGDAASGSAGPNGSRVSLEAEPGSIWELGPGQKFSAWTPSHPSTAYGDFTSAVLHKVAAALGVTYESLSGDLSQVTYLSARSGLMVERMVWTKLQQWWIRVFVRRVFDWWLESAFLSGELVLPGGDWRMYRSVLIIPRGFGWIDPGKDADAAGRELDLNLTTHSDIFAARGGSFEDFLERKKRDVQLAAKYGVDLAPPPKAAFPPRPAAGGGDNEDPAKSKNLASEERD